MAFVNREHSATTAEQIISLLGAASPTCHVPAKFWKDTLFIDLSYDLIRT